MNFVELPEDIMILTLFAVLSALAIWGITESITVASLFTLLEIAGLVYIIYLAKESFFVFDGH